MVVGVHCFATLAILGIKKIWKSQDWYEDEAMVAQSFRFVAEPLAAGLLVFLVIGALFLSAPLRETISRDNSFTCTADDYPLYATIGYGGTYLLDMTDKDRPDLIRGEVNRSVFFKGIPPDNWWWSPPPPEKIRSFLHVYPTRTVPQSPYALWRIYSEASVSAYWGESVGLCVSRHDEVSIFGANYLKLNRIHKF